MISLALYLPLVITPDTYAFDCKKYLVQNWRELFTRKKLTVIIFRNFMKSSRWERKMKIWENCNAKMTKKQISIILNEGYIELITWREIASVQYNSRCGFILIDSVMTECNMSCPKKKRGFTDCECFALKGKELNLNYRITQSPWRNM